MSDAIPGTARVVIIGGGVIGCSVAYHLTKLGWKDVVLLERKQLTCGTTWHAAGLLTTLRSTESQTRLAKYTQDLYSSLEAETGQATGFNRCGSIQLASTDERVEEMRRGCAMARAFGVESVEITPAEVQQHWPLADVSDLKAGFSFPNDARVNPIDVTQALARAARNGGVKIFQNVQVTGIESHKEQVTGVLTGQGKIDAEYVVNCAGMWAREVGKLAGVDVPLQAAEHYYLVTESMQGMHGKLPILRDPGNCAYYREDAGKLLLGLFEPLAKPWAVDTIAEDFCFDELQPDEDRMMPFIEKAMQRIPKMLDTGIQLFFCGPESFTADHNYLMGEAPNLKNFYIAAGFNSLGILSAGGAGLVMADWIAKGHPPMDMWDVNIRRTHTFQNNKKYLADRVVESLGIGYQYHWPFRQWESARGVKKSVLHDRVAAAGACFGESSGWERPNWYASANMTPYYEYSYGRQNWFELSAEEHHAIRNTVGLFEQSSFSKILVQGRDAERILNRICTADMSVANGKCVYTQWLNERGGIEADLTVTRLTDEQYLVITAAFTHTHVISWLKQHIPDGSHCYITDITGAYAMLNIQGPKSRQLLQQLSSADFSHDAFQFGTMQQIDIGYQTVWALRLSYVGELGWELYIPTEYALPVYDQIIDVGRNIGLRHCGYHALNSLRIEKAYREWSHDIGTEDNPIQAGLAFTCAWEKQHGFIGKDALLRFRDEKIIKRRLLQFLFEDPEPLAYHNEPIYMDGKIVGYTTSGMYGHTLGACVAMGYIKHEAGITEDLIKSSRFSIEIAGQNYQVSASIKPLYDPKGERIQI